MRDYTVYQSEYVKNNIQNIIEHLHQAHRTFEKMFPSTDSTWSYDRYNIFSLAGPSSIFYNLFKELQSVITQQLGADNELWIQSWVNYMSYAELNRLDWHGHGFDYHGYIAIDPKNTYTDFKEYRIDNKVGQIYFGPGCRQHKVVALEAFEGKRITLGFDIVCTSNTHVVKTTQLPWNNMSFIPL